MKKDLNYPLTLILCTLLLISCKKEDSGSSNEYYFKYTVNGKTGGSTSGKSTSIFNINYNQSYTATGSSMGVLMASKSSDCNVNGNAPCYSAFISLKSLSVGTHSFNTYGNILSIRENQLSFTEKIYAISVSDGYGGGTVTLTEVGPVGGAVVGTFSGKAGHEDGSNGNTSEVPITGSFRLLRTQ